VQRGSITAVWRCGVQRRERVRELVRMPIGALAKPGGDRHRLPSERQVIESFVSAVPLCRRLTQSRVGDVVHLCRRHSQSDFHWIMFSCFSTDCRLQNQSFGPSGDPACIQQTDRRPPDFSSPTHPSLYLFLQTPYAVSRQILSLPDHLSIHNTVLHSYIRIESKHPELFFSDYTKIKTKAI
jgi:hypothetical protein